MMAGLRERYDLIRATISGGFLSWRYRLEGSPVFGVGGYQDDGVLDWSEADVKRFICSTLDVSPEEGSLIEIVYN